MSKKYLSTNSPKSVNTIRFFCLPDSLFMNTRIILFDHLIYDKGSFFF